MAKQKLEDEELLDAPPDDATDRNASVEDSTSIESADVSAMEGAEAVAAKPLYEEYGLDETFKDVTDHATLVKRLADERKAQAERFDQTLAQRQREWQQQTQDFLKQKQWREEQAARQQQQPAEKPKWWNPPAQWNPEWDQFIQVNPETGKTEVNAPTEQIKNDIYAYARYKKEHDEKWNNDREGYLRGFVEQVFPELMQQHFSRFHEQQLESQRLGQLETESAGWLYQHDEQGNMIRDLDGTPGLSAVGVNVMEYARHLHQKGLGSQSECFVAARDAIIGRHLLAQHAQTTNAESAKKASDSRKLDALDANAKRRSNRNGSDANPEHRDPPPQTRSARNLFAQDLDKFFTPEGVLAHSM